ncbi:HlyD family efflux transporter periplasmic adaptor subunit [Nocardiopsis sp. JB363]|uniref:HlyD family efflux transporter periplasmic adaptor subunit n=1 Tax=Nocardiopsis sp. JB363 TaxID=1434837 RepID=UPI00097B4A0B|nr:HlyD family efflux transporter periplasmic adaptor subunit [Nocardiopsis sp. JB363]SIO89452.1 Membrane-fusion protein [Nocardiopsis sp. JB363]
MKKWIIVGAVAALLLGLVASGYLLLSRMGSAPTDEDVVGAAADVSRQPVEIELGTVSSQLVLDATVQAEPGKPVEARQGGTVTHLWLNDGANVEEGAPVVSVSLPAEPAPEAEEDESSSGSREVTLYAPVSGTVSGLDDVRVDDVLEPGAKVATVSTGEFHAVAQVPANDLYRFYDDPGEIMLQIDKGPPAAECDFIGLGASEQEDSGEEGAEAGETGAGGGSELTCRIPSDLTVFDGVQGKLSVSTGEVENVVVVPVTAVRGNTESGEVVVVDDAGAEETREVSLGMSDGQVIEVTEGLSVGDQVLDPVPLDPRFDIPEDPTEEEFDDELPDEGFEDEALIEEEG